MPVSRRAQLVRDAIVPVLVLALVAATYVWISGRELGAPEQRNLNREVIVEKLLDHLTITGVSAFFVLIIAIPAGVLLTRPAVRWATPVVLALANIGQSAPVIGVLVLLVIITGQVGLQTAVISIVVYSVLPIIRNTIVGIQGVDRNTLDAAKGLGMSKIQVLFRVELPLAVPVILAGVRTALILIVGVATLATFVNAGGAGDLINTGLKLQRVTVLVTGAVLAACIALMVDWVAGIAERLLTPRGFRVGVGT